MNIKDIIKLTQNEYANVAEDAICGEINGWVDSGSYTLNALLSGSIFKGFPSNKIVGFVGVESCGKTFYTLAACKNFLEKNKDGIVIYFETENALTKDILSSRGIDLSRFVHLPVATVQEFKNQALKIVDEKLKEKDQSPFLFVLDSLGNLSTNKEMEDSAAGSDTRDMTRAQIIKATFRVLALKLGMANIPMIFTNHVYAKIGCAEKGTKVKTLNGDKNIEDVKIGEQVLTLVGNKEVTNIFSYSSECVYEIEFDDHTKLVLTEDHKLMNQMGEWKKVSDLTEEDIIISVF